MKRKKLDLLALASIPLVMTLGNSMLIPVLPILQSKISITQLQSSLIITIYSVVAIVFIPIAGYLSDRFGRKVVIIPSLIIVAIGGAISAFASWKLNDPYYLIMIGRFIQGVGAAGAFPVVIPTVGDMYRDEDDASQALGIIETSNTFGKVLSPIIGSLLAQFLWYLPFIFVPIFSITALLLIIFLVKVPKRTAVDHQAFKAFKKKINKTFRKDGKWIIAVFIIGVLNMFVLFGYQFNFSNLLENEYEIKGVYGGLILAIPLLILCISSFLSGKIIGDNKVLMKRIIFGGNLLVSIPFLFIFKGIGLVLMTIFLSISSIGIGLSLPCLDTLITKGVKKNIRGSVTSIYSSMRFLGVATGPPIVAIIESDFKLLYFVLAGLSALAALICALAIKPN